VCILSGGNIDFWALSKILAGETPAGTCRRLEVYEGAVTRGLPLVAVIGAAGLLLAPSADAKFRVSIAMEPSPPRARVATRVVVRTDVDLKREHGIRLTAVGPWRTNLGQAVVEIRLAWRDARTLVGRVRFPYAGRWHLDVPSPPVSIYVRVRR
jgi:hypothetical protein